MKVLMISGDKHLLTPDTPAAARLALQKAQVERLDVFVWPAHHTARQISRAAHANHYDVITTQDPFWRGLLGLWVRPSGTKLNVQVHTDLARESLFKRLMARYVLRRADSVRAVSESIGAYVAKLGAKHIHILPIYIDLDRYRSITRHSHTQSTILWLGRFEPEKNPLAALEILKQVRAEGIDAKLILQGAGSLESEIKQEMSRLALNECVELRGWQANSTEALADADVVLCTSRFESYGASIIEALAAGVPVVAPDVGIAREAGTIVVERSELASAVAKVLKEKPAGVLRLNLRDVATWATAWKESLV